MTEAERHEARVAIVTGGTRGIGEAIARALARGGLARRRRRDRRGRDRRLRARSADRAGAARRDRRCFGRGADRALPAHRRAGELRRHPARRRDEFEIDGFRQRARREPHRHDADVRRRRSRSSPRRKARSSTPPRCMPSSARRTRRPMRRRRAAWRSSRNRSPSPGRRTASASTPSRRAGSTRTWRAARCRTRCAPAPILGAHADGPLGQAGRCRGRGALPALRRGALRHRRGAAGRRRLSRIVMC